MKNKYTIIEAAKKVLSLTDDSMSVAEIYAQILEKSLYVFKISVEI
jgi:restriction system protein